MNTNTPGVPFAADNPGLLELIEPLAPRPRVTQRQALAALEKSLAHWRAFLAQHPKGYAYLRSHAAATDHITNDFVEVRGTVLEHRCEEWGGPLQAPDGAARPAADAALCHRPLNVDQLYQRCREMIEASSAGVVMELHRNGILAVCAMPNARCSPSSNDCLTLRWVWDPHDERPCVAAMGAYPHGSIRRQECNDCICLNGLEGCTDAGPEMCRPRGAR